MENAKTRRATIDAPVEEKSTEAYTTKMFIRSLAHVTVGDYVFHQASQVGFSAES